jgi:hypothetical protein
MSPTYLEFHMARLDQELDAARQAVDLARIQSLVGEQTSLLRSMYGHRPA